MKIVVLGSKPGAKWPSCDHIYMANRALSDYPAAVESATHKHLVGSWIALHPALKEYFAHPECSRQALDSVTVWNTRGAAISLARHAHRECDTEGAVRQLLQDDGIRVRIVRVFSSIERRHVWEDLTGLKEPITEQAFLFDPRQTVFALSGFFTWCLRRSGAVVRASTERVEAPGVFRPSTGVMALCLAIREHGPNADYVVAGIGLKNRNDYTQARDRHSEWTRRVLPSHANADRQILAALASNFKVSSTEPELHPILPDAT